MKKPVFLLVWMVLVWGGWAFAEETRPSATAITPEERKRVVEQMQSLAGHLNGLPRSPDFNQSIMIPDVDVAPSEKEASAEDRIPKSED